MTNLQANKKILSSINRQLHLLEQGILPPELEKQGLEIFKTIPLAIEGFLRARIADKANVEHIIRQYEEKVE